MDETLAHNVIEWLKTDEKIKEINALSKQLKETKNALNDKIIEQMIKQKVDSCKLPNGDNLVLKTQIQFSALNKEYIQETLKDHFSKPLPSKNPETIATSLTESLFNGRESTEKAVLRKIKGK